MLAEVKNMEQLNQTFSDNLKYYMTMRDITQADIARALKVSTSSVSYWVTGQKIPRADRLAALCRLFRIEMSDLLTEKMPVQSFEQELFYNEAVMMRKFGELSDRDKQVVRDLIDSLTKKGDE